MTHRVPSEAQAVLVIYDAQVSLAIEGADAVPLAREAELDAFGRLDSGSDGDLEIILPARSSAAPHDGGNMSFCGKILRSKRPSPCGGSS